MKIKMLPAVCSAHDDRFQPGCTSCTMARRVNQHYNVQRVSVRHGLFLLALVVVIITMFEWLV